MLVEHIVKIKGSDVVTVGTDELVADVAATMVERRIGVIVVCAENKRVVGVISERDIVRAVAQWPEYLQTLQVSQLYTENPVTCSMKDDAREVMHIMHEGRFRHMPIVEHGKLMGLISIGDLLTHLLDEAGKDVEGSAWSDLTYL